MAEPSLALAPSASTVSAGDIAALRERVEVEAHLSPRQLAKIDATLAKLATLPGQLRWVQARYLQSILAFGDEVVPDTVDQLTLAGDRPSAVTLRCSCGAEVVADPPAQHRPFMRSVAVDRCPECGRTVAFYPRG
jgi:endogenous inhibitor of DNA gyrase (YacG/DUF329 family)